MFCWCSYRTDRKACAVACEQKEDVVVKKFMAFVILVLVLDRILLHFDRILDHDEPWIRIDDEHGWTA